MGPGPHGTSGGRRGGPRPRVRHGLPQPRRQSDTPAAAARQVASAAGGGDGTAIGHRGKGGEPPPASFAGARASGGSKGERSSAPSIPKDARAPLRRACPPSVRAVSGRARWSLAKRFRSDRLSVTGAARAHARRTPLEGLAEGPGKAPGPGREGVAPRFRCHGLIQLNVAAPENDSLI